MNTSSPSHDSQPEPQSLAAPKPIFDSLEHIANPFYRHDFSAESWLNQVVTGADLDLEYASKFLYSYNGSKATFNSYRRDVERLLHWSWLVAGHSVRQLKRHHIEDFIRFCQAPPKTWIGLKQATRFIQVSGQRQANPSWRPFQASLSKQEQKAGHQAKISDFELSQQALKAMFAVLSSFYNFLIQEEVTDANPVALIRQKSKFLVTASRREVRRISNLQWQMLVEQADAQAAMEPEIHERTRFVVHCLLCMYLRISEIVADDRSTPMMHHFHRDSDGHWWFDVIGKGNKERSVAVSDDMLQALQRFRAYLGLSALPLANESTPLLPKLRGRGGVRSTAWIRAILQQLFDQTYDRMVAKGLANEALELQAATVHWLRHTGISEDVKTRPIEHVRDDAGHTSAMTTDRYIDAERRARHASARNKPGRPKRKLDPDQNLE